MTKDINRIIKIFVAGSIIILVSVFGYWCWNFEVMQRTEDIEFLELEIRESEIKIINVSTLQIRKANGFDLIKENIKGLAVFSDGTKKAIIFYPQSNNFRFVDSRQRYNIQYHGLLAYQMN